MSESLQGRKRDRGRQRGAIWVSIAVEYKELQILCILQTTLRILLTSAFNFSFRLRITSCLRAWEGPLFTLDNVKEKLQDPIYTYLNIIKEHGFIRSIGETLYFLAYRIDKPCR